MPLLLDSLYLRLLVLLLALAPLFSNYVFEGMISVGDVFCIVAFFGCLLYLRLSYFFLGVIFSCFVVVFVSLAFLLMKSEVSASFFRAAFFLALPCFLLSMREELYAFFLRSYLSLSLIFSVFLVVQVMVYYIFNQGFTLMLPWPTYEGDTVEVLDHAIQGFRTGGVFREPSYFSIYVIPALFFFALRRNYVKQLLLVGALVLSTSSMGLAASIFSFAFYLNASGRLRENFKRVLFAVSAVVVAVLLLLFFRDVSWVERFLDAFGEDGPLRVRLEPMLLAANNAGLWGGEFGSSDTMVNSFFDGGEWHNSVSYLLMRLGWLFLLPFMMLLIRLGTLGALACTGLIFFTNAFSNAFSTVFLLAFYSINLLCSEQKLKYSVS
ncbi:hypothetical protein HX881_09305 [Pseudomonas gingeri]|uniref:hypothetical protein n=1 Tax=Pseudomonas gingeri TaxID=117681 RepID=UPI0015A2819F|nr:hypothetical protein [Pseudomonas gingeri]NVZ25737.1 hypothetical protein [Pseudomonas gingeri]